MRVAIYVRKSTKEQNIEAQQQQLEQYAKMNNYDVYKIYSDTISGAKASRPGLNELMNDSRRGCFNAVMVTKLDRLGRSTQHLLRILEEWNKHNVQFISVSQGMDTTTAAGKMIFTVIGAIAEFERELLSERTREAFYVDEQGVKRCIASNKAVGKRGKDNKPRKKGGYFLRYQKDGRGVLNDFSSLFNPM